MTSRTPHRVQLSRKRGARMSAHNGLPTVSVARPTKWGNPYYAGYDGTRLEVIAKYEVWLQTRPELLAALPELRGKVLGCWCRPWWPCHGDVLARLADATET